MIPPIRDNGLEVPAVSVPLSGLAELAARYEGYIIDLWGTVHDGVHVYPAAIDVLQRLRGLGAQTCLLSNAARSKTALARKLAGMGLEPARYDHLVTSGQATIDAFRQPDAWHAALGRRYLLIAPEDGERLLTELSYTEVEDPCEAGFVLNTGSTPGLTLADHARVLGACVTQKLPMVCANPDLFVRIAGRPILCAGAIARRYAALGGIVRYHGKPEPEIYQTCLARMKLPAQAVLAIGDGLETDIAGARNAGIASTLVLSGLHTDLLDETGGPPALHLLQQFLAGSDQTPTYVLAHLSW